MLFFCFILIILNIKMKIKIFKFILNVQYKLHFIEIIMVLSCDLKNLVNTCSLGFYVTEFCKCWKGTLSSSKEIRCKGKWFIIPSRCAISILSFTRL